MTQSSILRKSPAIGIDLGTTYSVVAYLDDTGRPMTIVNSEGDLITPSAVLFDGESCPRSELIGQCVLDKAPAIAGSHGLIAKVERSRRRFASAGLALRLSFFSVDDLKLHWLFLGKNGKARHDIRQ